MPGADLEIMMLDLGSLESVKNFADAYLEKYAQLDILINNAGLMMPPLSHTRDGFESQFGVNYLGHFHLTNLLFPLISSTNNSRIVTVSSSAHKVGKIDFNNLNGDQSYSAFGAYSQSKLACLIFAYELQLRIQESGCKVISLAAHPGFSVTDLFRHVPKFVLTVLKPIVGLVSNSIAGGSMPTVMAALSPSAQGGEYYGPQGFRELKGKPGLAESSKTSHDRQLAIQLWKISEELTGRTFSVTCGSGDPIKVSSN